MIVAGTGYSGATANMLKYPSGIFVTIDFDLYAADYSNNRIQLFRSGELQGRAVVENGSH